MAGEPILIVDDTPVNLKLTRILLVNEGYRVQTAASAEEALELLRTYHPLLVLADIQLPGMDGLEMTRRIKSEERTRDIAVVALTAFAMKGDEQRALAAGCDGYITKPIDTRTLGGRIRGYLASRGAPQDASRNTAAPRLVQQPDDEELRELRRRFLEEGGERSRQILLDLDGVFDAPAAARVLHQWIGSAGLLGYAAISRKSREVESLLLERPVDSAQLRESLTGLVLAFSNPHDAFDHQIPGQVLDTLTGKVVGLVGLPSGEADRLCTALEIAHARPVFYELDSRPDRAALEMCDLAAVYVRPETMDSGWLNPETLRSGLPVVLVGGHHHLAALDLDVQMMADGLLMGSWQPEEALVRLFLALSHSAGGGFHFSGIVGHGGPIEVLIADDDSDVRETLRLALASEGMQCLEAADGLAALSLARDRSPIAAVLDVEMPGLNGYDVVQALRLDRSPLGILLLTGERQQGEVLRGFDSGADDYLIKPFSSLELATRVKRTALAGSRRTAAISRPPR